MALAVAITALPIRGWAVQGPLLQVTPGAVPPGGVVALRLAQPGVFIRATAGGRELPLPAAEAQSLLLGVDLEASPGRLPVVVDLQEGGRLLRLEGEVRILDSRYPVQRLTLPRRFSDPDAATLDRIAAEKAVLDRLWTTVSASEWRGAFRFPLEGGKGGANFGLRRIINGEPRAPHSGLDVPAPHGTPVVAANAGRVALVADHFFSGTSVILDHGGALFTMYFHLQEALVREGERLARGQPIGRVGSTGRSSGPHLHWGVRLHGARVDPMALLRITGGRD
jgi:hypothetical protein